MVSFEPSEYGNALLVLACTPDIHPLHIADVSVDGVVLTLLKHGDDTFTLIVPDYQIGLGAFWEPGQDVNIHFDPPLY